MRRLLVLIAVGAVLGPILDGFHTHSGMTSYPEPWVLRMAWWVPILFAGATLTIGLSHPLLDRLLRRPRRPIGLGSVAGGLCAYATLYAASAWLPLGPTAKGWALGAGALGLWLAFDRTWQGTVLAFFTAAGGCATEALLVRYGIFAHLVPDLPILVPSWLPWLYIGASICIGNLGRILDSDPAGSACAPSNP